jgi:hypothetical protein
MPLGDQSCIFLNAVIAWMYLMNLEQDQRSHSDTKMTEQHHLVPSIKVSTYMCLLDLLWKTEFIFKINHLV